ncbi:Holliday junction branch migration protein RuvA [Alphaproteobacteria bacterium]|nr:Holliday junction branch migration protein RuvA [Alphaproteobacteria bacterium]
MIGKLRGTIDSFQDNHLILDVGGVGYLVFASNRTLSRIGQIGDPATILIDTHVREDHIHLYGFADKIEQEWFRLLTSVQGVGAKAGLSILAVCPPEKLALIIASGDKAAITAADGVGPKIGVRILTELKDKAGKMEITANTPMPKIQIGGVASDEPAGIDGDAVSALVNLGYARSDAFTAVAKAKEKTGDNDNLQELIKVSLKELSA